MVTSFQRVCNLRAVRQPGHFPQKASTPCLALLPTPQTHLHSLQTSAAIPQAGSMPTSHQLLAGTDRLRSLLREEPAPPALWLFPRARPPGARSAFQPSSKQKHCWRVPARSPGGSRLGDCGQSAGRRPEPRPWTLSRRRCREAPGPGCRQLHQSPGYKAWCPVSVRGKRGKYRTS